KLQAEINALGAVANTPLAETYYEVTRYFRGEEGIWNNRTYTSPITRRCQNNYVIVITDGFPTYDNNFPTPTGNSGDSAYVSGGPRLPNWDGAAPATVQSNYPAFPQYSDG